MHHQRNYWFIRDSIMSAAEDVGRSCLTRDNYEIGISLLGEDRSILLATTRLDLRRDTASYNLASSQIMVSISQRLAATIAHQIRDPTSMTSPVSVTFAASIISTMYIDQSTVSSQNCSVDNSNVRISCVLIICTKGSYILYG